MIAGLMTYTLSRPVTSVDRVFTELTLREPTGLDLRSCGDQSAPGYTNNLIARLAGITPAAVDAMAGRDVVALGKRINRDFLETPEEPANSSTDTTNLPDSGTAAA